MRGATRTTRTRNVCICSGLFVINRLRWNARQNNRIIRECESWIVLPATSFVVVFPLCVSTCIVHMYIYIYIADALHCGSERMGCGSANAPCRYSKKELKNKNRCFIHKHFNFHRVLSVYIYEHYHCCGIFFIIIIFLISYMTKMVCL